ncbi:MAG TPA: flagellar hook-associated protein FlgK [Chloroflexota bacterium]|nr:flagellar hook-associated protein FlgK [Chloroflexota bacterium]
MTGSFFGLDLSLRALQAQQLALDVTGQNVANSNTAGYSRQTVNFATTAPYTLPGMNRAQIAGQVGTGVVVAGIDRARDLFADVQYRAEASVQSQAQAQSDALQQVQTVLNEPSSTGLSAMLSNFFGAWQDLANNPSDTATRAPLVQQAAALASGFNRAAQGLSTIQQNLNDHVKLDVDQVNSLSTQIAALNRQIVQVEVTGQRANDLRDRRDLLLDQVSQLAQIQSSESADGSVNVTLGGHTLVQGQSVDALTTTATGPGGMLDVRFTSDNSLATLNSGELRGLMDARDTSIPNYLGQLNSIAANLIGAVNSLHAAGYGLDGGTGRAFFAGTDAATIAVDPTVAANPNTVAAADAPNQAGNNNTALAIAQLQHTMSPSTGDSYNALIASLGVDARAAQGTLANQTALVQLLTQRRQTVSGVSLDEEATQMLRYQRAYEAAARLITTNDEMLDKLINGTGVVGR